MFEKSAKLGDLLAGYSLGVIYSENNLVYDLNLAKFYFKLSIDYPPSRFRLLHLSD